MLSIKNTLLTGMAALVFSSQPVIAQSYSPYGYNNTYNNGYGNNYFNKWSNYYNNMARNPYPNYGPNYGPNYPTNYNRGYNQNYAPQGYNQGYTPAPRPPVAPTAKAAPAPAAPYNATPAQPYPNQAYGYGQPNPYGNRPWYPKKKNNFMDNGPFNGGNFAEELWPGRDSVWEDAMPIDGPWNRNWGQAPWNRDYADMYGDEGGPREWFNVGDPKEGVAVMWEDALYTPHALGTMPGGWDAPTVVVPNPVDVGDEFKNASTDFPGEMRDFADGFTYGDRTITGNKAGSNPNAGGFGVGNNSKKKDGINIESKPRR